MTKAHETIYCVQCLSVKPKTEAELVFRTGFYRRTIPLGRCLSCANAERNETLFLQPPSEERSFGSAHLV